MLQQELFHPLLLARRLRGLGLQGVAGIEVHENRTVMVSITSRKVLRVHRGFAYASDDVLAAIVRFVSPSASRVEQREAERTLLAFPVDEFAAVSRRPSRWRRPRPRREDLPFVRELARRHLHLNHEHFGGELGKVAFRVSWKMKTRLGELLLDPRTDAPCEISISRRHLLRDGWEEVERTLLHEMVHQWQAEKGYPVDHGSRFRAKAAEVGVPPRAVRTVVPLRARRPSRRR